MKKMVYDQVLVKMDLLKLRIMDHQTCSCWFLYCLQEEQKRNSKDDDDDDDEQKRIVDCDYDYDSTDYHDHDDDVKQQVLQMMMKYL